MYKRQPSTIEVHWHEWLEIVHIIDGHMTTITPSGSFEVGPGDVIVIGMQSLHKMIGNAGHFRLQCLHINNGFIIQHMPSTLSVSYTHLRCSFAFVHLSLTRQV